MNSVREKRELLVRTALACLDKPFHYGALPEEAPEKFDCSSLVQYLYRRISVDLPRSSIEQAHIGGEVLFTQLEIGDLLFFRGHIVHYNLEFPAGVGHVALYLGNDQVIQATGQDQKVVITPLKEIKRRKDFVVAKRILK